MSGIRRKALIKHPSTNKSRVANLLALSGVRHLHFCADRECRMAYEDSCVTPHTNDLCTVCAGRRRSAYMPVRDPQECCLDNCEQVTYKPALILHRLAGPGPWFQCKTCARCHGWSCVT